MHRLLILVAVVASHFVLASGQVAKLKEQLILLQNDVAGLQKHIEDLNSTLHTLCSCENKNVTTHTIVANETRPVASKNESHNPFRILEVKRSFLRSKNVLYSVTYCIDNSTSLTNQFAYWNRRNTDYTFEKINGTFSQTNTSHGLNRTDRVVTTAENQTSVLFVFGAAEMWYMLHLNNSHLRTMTFTNVSLPGLKVVPKEIVYTMGKNASFQVQLSKNLSFHRDFQLTDDVLTRVDTHGFVQSLYRLEPSESNVVILNETKNNGEVANVTLDMTYIPLSGVITFRVQDKNQNSSLVDSIDVYRRFVIRPSNQSGPFHDNMFTFHNPRNNGASTRICKLSARCSVRCPLAVGSNVTEMMVWHKNKYNTAKVTAYRLIKDPFFVSEFSGVVPEGVDEAFCNATELSRKTYKTISSQGIKIRWISPPKVISGKARLKGNGAFYKTLRVVCSARGTPLPTMFINVACSVGHLTFMGRELEIVAQSGNFIKVSKDVILSREFFSQMVNVSCVARNEAFFDTKKLRPLYIRKR